MFHECLPTNSHFFPKIYLHPTVQSLNTHQDFRNWLYFPVLQVQKIRTSTSYEDAPVVLQRQEQDTRQIGPPFMRDSRLANELCERRVPPERDQ